MNPTNNKFVCIHAHFYQPPRENPWLDAIEPQKTAAPFKDWNERVSAECYGPNAYARILNEKGQIEKIVNNFSKISFNVGPTLLIWMQQKAPDVYQAVLEADKESQTHFGGHGSALAQSYNHMIMPLASREDKITQTIWGIKDFEYRFKRKPEGMWLPETAVDCETLGIMADLGIKFTILAPRQAKKFRALNQTEWIDTPDETVDTTVPYIVNLPSGNSINVFFYNHGLSHDIAFGDLLKSGDHFVNSIIETFPKKSLAESQLVHVATDGETYGHHNKFSEMALAYTLKEIQSREDCQLTNYAQFLAENPPQFEAQIVENTSWSCAHGIERWQSDCGCHTGGEPSWNQAWRKPLRESLDRLRQNITPQFRRLGKELLMDPWDARNDYIHVVLEPSLENRNNFFNRHEVRSFSEMEKSVVLKLMEMQRQSMLMATSCGWFFNDISGIETVQILLYAGRTLELAGELFEDAGEKEFLEILKTAVSNDLKEKNGQDIYRRALEKSKITAQDLGGSLVELVLINPKNAPNKLFHYLVETFKIKSVKEGEGAVAYGYGRLRSEITWESSRFFFCEIQGQEDYKIFIKPCKNESAYKKIETEFKRRLEKDGINATLKRLTTDWEDLLYTPSTAFAISAETLIQKEFKEKLSEVVRLFEPVSAMINELNHRCRDTKEEMPKSLAPLVDLNRQIQWMSFLENDDLTFSQMETFLKNRDQEIAKSETFKEPLQKKLERLVAHLKSKPDNVDNIKKLEIWLDFLMSAETKIDLWKAQNTTYEIAKEHYTSMNNRAANGDKPSQKWIICFNTLSHSLNTQLPKIET
jgi:alpha-amylase/alpha-mannosidase (GH57 family)